MTTLLTSLFLLPACVEDVGKNKVEAEVGEAERVEAPAADAVTWKVDRSQSTLKALGAKITATHPIEFDKWRGEVTVDDGALAGISFEADMTTVQSDHPKLTQHLKGEDFFWVEKHPKATFQSTKITEGGEGDATHTVTGNLTVRGMTKSVTFPATIETADDMVKAKTEFVIDRQDFGVTYPGKADDAIQDNVVLTVDFTAKP
jgi:polyisoprenoid-binding protein YceI